MVDEATAMRLAARIGARRACARDASARVRADGEKGAILRREGLDQIMGRNAKECI
jgi:hypothetical protein